MKKIGHHYIKATTLDTAALLHQLSHVALEKLGSLLALNIWVFVSKGKIDTTHPVLETLFLCALGATVNLPGCKQLVLAAYKNT